MPTLAVVIVNYQSWDDVARLVGAVSQSPALRAGTAEVLVVDNASDRPIPASLAPPPLGVRVLALTTNGGFSAGVNAGWRASKSRWLLVLNPDIEAAPDLIDQVLRRIAVYEARPEPIPGVVGFALRNPDGTRQPSVGVFPSLARTIREQVLPRSRRKYQPDWRHRAGPVDWVTGACFLIAAPLLEAVGGMDEDFFLYHEEVALCRVATRRGWTVEFDPSVAVVHLHPLQDRAISARMRIITRHSKLLYFGKHLPGWQLQGLAWVIRVEAKAQALRCRWLGRRREELAWRAVEHLARRPRQVLEFRGSVVRVLAEAVEGAADPEVDSRSGSGPPSASVSEVARIAHHLALRSGKDGSCHEIHDAPDPRDPLDGRRDRVARLEGRPRRDRLRR